MFIAIIIPPGKKDKAVLIAVAAGFLLSFLANRMDLIRNLGLSSGTITILLTILISAAAALAAPRTPEKNQEAAS